VPVAKIAPGDVVEFPFVAVAQSAVKVVALSNTGQVPLELTGLTWNSDATFSVLVDGEPAAKTHVAPDPVKFQPPLIVAPGQSLKLQIRFASVDEHARHALLTLLTNDPSKA
jgi:hypothetical protein